MAGTEFTIKDINKTIESEDKEGDKPIKYKIEYKNKNGDKITVDNKKGTKKITADKITKIVEGKKDEEVTDKSVEISYVDGGWFTHYGKIDKVASKKPAKEDNEVSFSGINSFRPTTWIVGFVALVLIVGGI